MSKVSIQQQNLLRTRPHRVKLYLSIFEPSTLFTCQITGSVARNDYQIPYYNPSGDFNTIAAGMTMMVGSTAGAQDIGRIRIRSVDASQFTVAENSNIDWQVGQYITVLRYLEIWPVFPRIIPDPSNPENTLWYKDYDIAYTNQNTIFGALPCAGPHRAAFTGDNIYYTASGTAHVADASMSYHWWFDGGTVTGSHVLTPGNITYNTPGHYLTRLIISGSNGSVDTSYRYVSIYDRPETGSANAPISRWSMSNIDGSRPGGGYTVSFTVRENITLNEGDVVVLFGESWYGTTKQNIGGNAENNSNIFFVGHILKNTIQYNYKTGETTFEVGNVTEYMKEQEGFSISVESVASPAYWYQLYDMDVNKAIYHYLRWQSTVLSITDVQSLVDDRPLQYFDSDRTSLYDAIDNLLRGGLLGGVTSDIQGKIWVEHGADALPSLASQSYSTPIMELKKQDWIDTPRIDEQLAPSISYVEYGGIAFSGVSTGTFSPLMSNAPGPAPLYRGKTDIKQGLALRNQTELNGITGNILANRNHRYPNIDYRMAGAYRPIDIAPQEVFTLQVEASDTPRGVAISGSFMPDHIAWAYDPQKQTFAPSSLTFKPLTSGLAGQTIVIPEIVDDGGFGTPGGGAGVKIPPVPLIYFPPLLANLGVTPKLNRIGNEFGITTSVYLTISGIPTRSISYNYDNYLTPTTVGGQPAWAVNVTGIYSLEIYIEITATGATTGRVSATVSRGTTPASKTILSAASAAIGIPSGGGDGYFATTIRATRKLLAGEYVFVVAQNNTDASSIDVDLVEMVMAYLGTV